jgi:hypothetical protein
MAMPVRKARLAQQQAVCQRVTPLWLWTMPAKGWQLRKQSRTIAFFELSKVWRLWSGTSFS